MKKSNLLVGTLTAIAAGLTACAPETPQSIHGIVTDASMNDILVVTDQGDTVAISTMDADPAKVPGVLVDDDGKVYLASPKFFICRLDPSDYSRVMPETCRDVTQYMPVGDEPFEGPSLRKRNGIYYYIYIQNKGNIERDGAVPTLMGYMTAENPLGPYTYRGVIVTNYDYPASGNIHGSIEPFDGQWYVSYHMPVSELVPCTQTAEVVLWTSGCD